jgi:hypothetical protein
MKLSILSEAASAKKQEFLARKFGVDPSIVQQASDVDPTKKGKYTEWIISRVKTGDIDLNRDTPKISSALRDFDTISNKKLARQQYNLQDINQYSLEDLVKISNTYKGETGEKPESIEVPDLPGVKKIYDDGVVAILEVIEPASAVKLGSGTKWCTSRLMTARDYLKKGPLYVIYKDGKKFAQTNTDELKNLRDQEIYDKEVFGVLDKAGIDTSQLYWNYAAKTGERMPEAEPAIMKNPETAFNYANDIIQGRWPEAEPYIMKDPKHALKYAAYIYDSRWPEAEPYIAQDPYWAYLYAYDVLKGRWPEAEPTIMKDPKSAAYYADSVIQGRWPEAEPYIAQDFGRADRYVSEVISWGGPWDQNFVDIFLDAGVSVIRYYFDYAIRHRVRIPELEPYILKMDSDEIYLYIGYANIGRWPEAEPVFMKDPFLAIRYARDVIQGRWPEAEPYIAQEPKIALYYARDIIKGRFPEAEPIIAKKPSLALEYAHDIIGGRWPEAEPYIMKDPHGAYIYAVKIIKGRWPEAEPHIASSYNARHEYGKKFGVPLSHFNTIKIEENLSKIFGLLS